MTTTNAPTQTAEGPLRSVARIAAIAVLVAMLVPAWWISASAAVRGLASATRVNETVLRIVVVAAIPLLSQLVVLPVVLFSLAVGHW